MISDSVWVNDQIEVMYLAYAWHWHNAVCIVPSQTLEEVRFSFLLYPY